MFEICIICFNFVLKKRMNYSTNLIICDSNVLVNFLLLMIPLYKRDEILTTYSTFFFLYQNKYTAQNNGKKYPKRQINVSTQGFNTIFYISIYNNLHMQEIRILMSYFIYNLENKLNLHSIKWFSQMLLHKPKSYNYYSFSTKISI